MDGKPQTIAPFMVALQELTKLACDLALKVESKAGTTRVKRAVELHDATYRTRNISIYNLNHGDAPLLGLRPFKVCPISSGMGSS